MIRGAAARAIPNHIAIGQKQFPLWIEQLFNRARKDQALFVEARIDLFGEVTILFGMRAVVGVVCHAEADKIGSVFCADLLDQRLGFKPGFCRPQHGCGAVSVVGADVVALVATQPLKTHPDVGLNVLQQMAHVNRAVGIR